MSAWLNHYETRMMLYRDLGIMELDDEGMWIDRPLNESEWLEDELCPLPPPIPNHWLHEVDIESDAEAEPLPPGSGSRRADVEEPRVAGDRARCSPSPPCKKTFRRVPPAKKLPLRTRLFPSGSASNRRRLWFDLGRTPRARAAASLVPPQSRAAGLLGRAPPEPVAARGAGRTTVTIAPAVCQHAAAPAGRVAVPGRRA